LQRYSKAHIAFNPTFALATFFAGITPFMLQRYSNKCFKVNVFGKNTKDTGNYEQLYHTTRFTRQNFPRFEIFVISKPSAVRLPLVTGSFIKHVKKSFLCSPLKCRSIQTEPICRWCFKFCPKFLLDASLSFLCFQAPSIKECFLLWFVVRETEVRVNVV
jgi:hypothetical protein